MLRIVTLLLALCLPLPALAQSADDVAANRLFVEAVQLWNRAEGETGASRLATLQRVQLNLKTIIERHGGSALAVRLVIGETIGPLSVARVEEAKVDARAAVMERVFRDCPKECPEMVVVPAGHTYLASGRDVMIAAPFAVGKFEVTFAEWGACVSAGGCTHLPDNRRWGGGRQPVINVNWDDAQQYVAWLSRRTGMPYRLLSEAEWEYAAQANSGREQVAQVGANQANCNGCGSRWDDNQTAPVGSFRQNAFGLYDMLGSVWEWTSDCWNETYVGAPVGSSAPMSGDCSRRVLRGGSRLYDPGNVSSALRYGYAAGNRLDYVGFRVARAL